MKNIVLVFVSLFSGALQVFGFSGGPTSVIELPSNETSIIVNRIGLLSDLKTFTLRDAEGTLVFSDNIESQKNRVKYTLNKLPQDQYTVEITGNHSMEIYEIAITDEKVRLLDTERYFKPTVKVENEKVYVDLLSIYDESLRIKVYNDINEEVYTFSKDGKGSFNKVFNLENLEKGEYNMVISTDHFLDNKNVSL